MAEEFEQPFDETGKEQETKNFKCFACGADMVYDPALREMRCEYCGSTSPIYITGDIRARDLDFSHDNDILWDKETRCFSCANCGAKTVFDKAEIAKECAFCGSSNIVTIEDIGGIRPEAVIPFDFDKKAASSRYHQWTQKRFFAPKKFKEFVKEHEVKGVYSPCWTFDTHTFSTYNGVVGDYYYVTVKTRDGYRQERRVRYRKVSGNHHMPFRDIMIEASPHLTQSQFDKLMPFDLSRMVPYNKSFLFGYYADHYDKSLNDSWMQARSVVDNRVRQNIRANLKCDVVKSLNVSTLYNDKKYKYVLLPLYVGGTKYKDKLYNFYMNGINGKTYGSTPVSAGKVGSIVGIILGIGVILGILSAFVF